ncbi:hypothetical protein D3C83_18450 [compost metagenome]
MAFGIGIERISSLVHWDAEPDRGQDILQHAARRRMHVDIARSDQRQAGALSQLLQHG